MYHFNPASGETGFCRARKDGCPFKGEHYATEQEAARAYEATMETFPSKRWTSAKVLAALKAGSIATIPEGEERLIEPASIGVPRIQLDEADEKRLRKMLFDDAYMDELVMGEPTEVDITTISMTQAYLVEGPLTHYLEADSDDDPWDSSIGLYNNEYPTVGRLTSGKLAILDGSHRFARSLLRGDTTMLVHVVEPKD